VPEDCGVLDKSTLRRPLRPRYAKPTTSLEANLASIVSGNFGASYWGIVDDATSESKFTNFSNQHHQAQDNTDSENRDDDSLSTAIAAIRDYR
jgi:hypothetical protein